jgi:hypothetical protein
MYMRLLIFVIVVISRWKYKDEEMLNLLESAKRNIWLRSKTRFILEPFQHFHFFGPELQLKNTIISTRTIVTLVRLVTWRSFPWIRRDAIRR